MIGLIFGSSESGKMNSLFDFVNHQPDFDKINLYDKDPYEVKYQLLINKNESTDLKLLNDSKSHIEYSNDMDGIYKNINCFGWYDCWYA